MDIEIRNFGTVSNADVHIGGLTVITGENDTGKSTVGKILFSIVKAIARYEFDLGEDKDERLLSNIESLYFNIIRRSIDIASNTKIREQFHPRRLLSQLKLDPVTTINNCKEVLNSLSLEEKISIFAYESSISKLNTILAIWEEPSDKISAMNRAIGKAFFSEFRGEIISRSIKSGMPSVKVKDGASLLIDINWGSDTKFKFDFYDELGYGDATYVESPAIMQFQALTQMSKTLFEIKDSQLGRPTVPLHIKDLSNKLSDSIYGFFDQQDILDNGTTSSSVAQQIDKALGGSVSFDNEKNDFLLNRGGYSISSSNIASGIKSLGILGMLIRSGNAEANNILIIDEPEVNLHPKWQVLYSELICQLILGGVSVIITTHSPYIIDGLKHYAIKNKIDNNFYLAVKVDDELTNFIDITDDVSSAIDLLTEPLSILDEDDLNDF